MLIDYYTLSPKSPQLLIRDADALSVLGSNLFDIRMLFVFRRDLGLVFSHQDL